MDDTLDLEAEMDETISEVRKRNYVFSNIINIGAVVLKFFLFVQKLRRERHFFQWSIY